MAWHAVEDGDGDPHGGEPAGSVGVLAVCDLDQHREGGRT
jgi:hypothetical protein